MADQQASGRDKGKAPQRQQSFSDSEYGQIWGTSMDLGGFEGAPAFTSYEQYYLLQNLGTQITDPHTTSGPEQGTNFDWSSSFPNFPEYNSSSSVQQYVTGIIPSSSEGGLSIPPELQKSEGQSQPWAPILSSTADDSAGPSQHRPKRLKIDHQRPKRPSRSQSSLSTSITPSQTTAVTRPESTFTNPVNDTDNVSVFSGVTDFSQSSYGLTAKLGTVNLNQPPPLLPSIASPNDGSSTPNHAAKSPADFVTGEYACEFPDCDLSFRTKSDFVKHRARHVRPYKCTYPNCKNQQGFANDNELNRHEVSVHKLKSRKGNSKQYSGLNGRGCYVSTGEDLTKVTIDRDHEGKALDGILERVIEAGMETLLAQLTGQGSEALRKLSLCDRSGEQDHHTLESLNIAKSLRDLHGLFAPTRRRSADDYKHIHAATSSPFLQPPTINVDPAPDDTVAPEDLNALEVNPPSNLVTCIAGSQPEIQRNGHQQEQSSLRKSKVFKISYCHLLKDAYSHTVIVEIYPILFYFAEHVVLLSLVE
ncbi:putative c2h2 type zinc finger domain protein [Phaeomoniella chlamydospora]|uniref:Putative c2h2 type zinc finger domain protein n=1 Tax=Phaeomoniella chlamydospora TaxID=158046 RepID=A0A0G2ERQ7_PHACM|nr:putative c2h2 type zinc finger domain protein [Phaeomoniella chlamydospora]